jgi:thiol-disulfide isomerase/thioredoxin
MQIINHFSFLLAAGVILLVTGWIILQRSRGATRWLSLAALLFGLILSYGLFSPGPGEMGQDINLDARLENDRPVLLEFESPFCLGCMAAQPLVDQIVQAHSGQLDVVQVNILLPGSAGLRDRFRIQFTPTFVYLTRLGEESWRSVGTVDPELVRATLEQDS